MLLKFKDVSLLLVFFNITSATAVSCTHLHETCNLINQKTANIYVPFQNYAK